MSQILEVIVGKLPTLERGFKEALVEFGGEACSADPRLFYFADVRLTLRPVAPHIRRLLGDSLPADAQALVLDEQLMLDWAAGYARPETLDSFGTFLRELAKQMPYGVVIERPSPGANRTVKVPATGISALVDQLVRISDEQGLALVLVDEG